MAEYTQENLEALAEAVPAIEAAISAHMSAFHPPAVDAQDPKYVWTKHTLTDVKVCVTVIPRGPYIIRVPNFHWTGTDLVKGFAQVGDYLTKLR